LARCWLAECVGADLDRRELDDAQLLVTELVTNALVHGRGKIRISATANENRLLARWPTRGTGSTRPCASATATV
jgi:anti-sigma regulatory factor (Ser/Thr protein kinase)